MMISDLALGTLAVCFYYERVNMVQPHKLALAVTIGIGTLCYNFGLMSMLWLFSYKYWIIAREVPKLFFEAGRHITFNEQSYRICNIAGLAINFIPACLAAYFRAKLSFESRDGDPVPVSLVSKVQYLYYAVTGLELVSALFLLDALRRIKQSVKSNPFLVTDTKTLWLHITLIILQVISLTVAALLAIRAFSDPENKSYNTQQDFVRIQLYLLTLVS